MSDKVKDIIMNIILFTFLVAMPLGCALFVFDRMKEDIDLFSCEKAERAAKKYLSKNHVGSDYEIGSAYYDDKNERYYVPIISPSSQDSGFSLGYNNKGKLTYNSYEQMVVKKGNVAIRLHNEYKNAVYAAFEPAAPWDDFYCIGQLYWQTSDGRFDEPYYLISDELELDASYDLSEIGGKSGLMMVHVDVDSAKEVSMENLADILLYVRQTLDEADIPFYMVDCILDYHNGTKSKRLEVEEYLYEDIYEEDFEARLEKVVKQS